MPRATYNQQDILRAKLVRPSWYPLLVKSFTEEQAGTDGSALYVYEITIDGGEYNGLPIRYQISEKAEGMGIEFMEACGNEIKPGVSIDYEKQVGKKIEGFVQRGEYKGKGKNELVQFRKRQNQEAPRA